MLESVIAYALQQHAAERKGGHQSCWPARLEKLGHGDMESTKKNSLEEKNWRLFKLGHSEFEVFITHSS